MKLDYSKIDDIEFDGINHGDYPDYCDTFICSATYLGREMTDDELDALNEDHAFIYEKLMEYLH